MNSRHFKYTHWLRISSPNEKGKWENLKTFWDKYDCFMTVYYYDYNPFLDKIIKLDCNQSYQELDLDVNSMSDRSLKRIKAKPTNSSPYNKSITYFFEKELSIKINDKNKNISPEIQHQQIPVDAFSEFGKLKNIDFFVDLAKKEGWQIVKIPSERGYYYQLYFGKDKVFENRYEYAFTKFQYKSVFTERFQMFINSQVKKARFNLLKFVGRSINAFESKYEFVDGEKIGIDVKNLGLVLGVNNNCIDIFNFRNPMGEDFYSIPIDEMKKSVDSGEYKVNYNLLCDYEKLELIRYMKKKIERFINLCGDWDYRNIDMTEPHLQSIDIKKNTIQITCEKFSTKLDDYVSCEGGNIKSKNLVDDFTLLDLENKEDVLCFMKQIEDHIDFSKISKDLELEEQNELNKLEKEDIEEELEYE